MKYAIYSGIKSMPDAFYGSLGEVYDYVQAVANALNQGIYRSWEDEDYLYFDCGAKILRVKEL